MEIRRIIRIGALLAGMALQLHVHAQGVTATEIVIGQSAALTGPLAELGQEVASGAKAYFDYVNAQGGIHGRKIKLITLDDGYDTERAVENVRQLIQKEQVLSLFGVLGTPANVTIMPLITEARVPNFAPISGSDMVRTPFNRYVFHITPSYADEIDKILEHLHVRGLLKVAAVYQNNAFGKEGAANLERLAAARKMTLVGTASIESSGADADKAADTLLSAQPQAILLITAGKASSDFIKAYNKRAVGMQYFALSVMASQAAVKALGPEGIGVVVSQVSPFPFSATNRVVQEYQKVAKEMNVKNLSFTSILGFINAKVFADGLRRAGRNLTRESLVEALETMGRIDYDGVAINFTRTSHLGHRYVDLTVISKDGRFLR